MMQPEENTTTTTTTSPKRNGSNGRNQSGKKAKQQKRETSSNSQQCSAEAAAAAIPTNAFVVEQADTEEDCILELNVGGDFFMTTRSTMTRFPGTMLEAMFSGRHPILLRDKAGRVFLDRDPWMFRMVLTLLRGGLLVTTPFLDVSQAMAFRAELAFYGLVEPFWPLVQDLSSFSIDMDKPNTGSEYKPANTKEALLDHNYETGVCIAPNGQIEFAFPYEVCVSGMRLAAFRGGSWKVSNSGHNAIIEFMDRATKGWVEVGRIPAEFGQERKVHEVSLLDQKAEKEAAAQEAPIWSSRFRIRHTDFVGLSQVSFF